ncbi:VOC family protein [Deinococcus navajonensis]|uniref:VOC family protein n=1 Tax=Deinococcus navajonensis TaxID=309884 RepID=A0ABV8XNQ8_9DEIO
MSAGRLTGARLDHLVVAAQTLEAGRAWLEDRLGVTLSPGGEHTLFGTHNALLSLGPDAYLEIIAVNPAACAPARPRWFSLDDPAMKARLAAGPALIHWVVRVSGLPPAPEVLSLSRGALRWTLTVPVDGQLPMGGVQPSLIAWQTQAPPSRLPDAGVRLGGLRLGTPEPATLRAALDRLDLIDEVEVYEAPQPEVQATLLTREGPVDL